MVFYIYNILTHSKTVFHIYKPEMFSRTFLSIYRGLPNMKSRKICYHAKTPEVPTHNSYGCGRGKVANLLNRTIWLTCALYQNMNWNKGKEVNISPARALRSSRRHVHHPFCINTRAWKIFEQKCPEIFVQQAAALTECLMPSTTPRKAGRVTFRGGRRYKLPRRMSGSKASLVCSWRHG
jgi:hypothetical protein